MLVEKEVIRPGTYWYTDQQTGLPRKLTVTPALTQYWHEQGNAMLSAGLTVPVPCEHDFNVHPMTPADKLLNNAGWVKEYKRHDGTPQKGPGDRLFAVTDIQDESLAKKLPGTIRWTSPWINSFTDGKGKKWENVISHLALTTRPRIVDQTPFGSVAAALSIASETSVDVAACGSGFCLSRAGRLGKRKSDQKLAPLYPMAFSLFSGAAFGDGDFPPKKKGKKDDVPEFEEEEGGDDIEMDDDPTNDSTIDLEPFGDPAGDVQMEELLCDLLGALGIPIEHTGTEDQFKRTLYNAVMTKIHELVGKGDANKQPNRTNPPGQPPNNPKPGAPGGQPNPLIQQEQQPMFMSLEDIHKIADPTMKSVALAMHTENQKLRRELDAGTKTANSLRDAKLKEENAKRSSRVAMLGKLSPKAKADLDAMLALPAMALSMGDGGEVVDPMQQVLTVLEKGLSDLPAMLRTEQSALSVAAQPQDADILTEARADEIADGMARQMGCEPVRKAG